MASKSKHPMERWNQFDGDNCSISRHMFISDTLKEKELDQAFRKFEVQVSLK